MNKENILSDTVTISKAKYARDVTEIEERHKKELESSYKKGYNDAIKFIFEGEDHG